MSKAQLSDEQKAENKRIAAQKAAHTRARKKSEAEAQNNFARSAGGVSTIKLPPAVLLDEEEMEAEIKRNALVTSRLNLDAAVEDNARRINQKQQKRIQSAQIQLQMQAERSVRIRAASGCNHRQGGMMTMGYSSSKGRGPTALNRVIFPDSRIILCNAGCGLRLFSPHQYDQSTVVRSGETMEQMMARVAQYHADSQRFEELWERAETEAVTPESAQIMDCGVTVKFLDANGYEVLPRRQCDDYALKM